ncbi:MAG: hypothetical protein IANPNBLG_02261 [Bryobacteraceae bacterium]|nr:hypothetical protein [Bryobacteraceae bacterium]
MEVSSQERFRARVVSSQVVTMSTRNSMLLTFFLALFATSALTAQDEGIPWLDNYQAALREAKRTQKPIFLEFRCEA